LCIPPFFYLVNPLFKDKQNSKDQGGKNEATQSEIPQSILGNGHVKPHFIATIKVAMADTKAARAAIKPDTATIQVADFSLSFFFTSFLYPYRIKGYGFQRWRWRESNPRPDVQNMSVYRFSRLLYCRERLG